MLAAAESVATPAVALGPPAANTEDVSTAPVLRTAQRELTAQRPESLGDGETVDTDDDEA